MPDEPPRGGRLLPRTRGGRLCAWLLAAAVGAFVLAQVLVASGQRGGEAFTDNWWLLGTMGAAALCMLASALAGVVAIGREHERSVLVFLAVGIGALAAVFLLGEALVPH